MRPLAFVCALLSAAPAAAVPMVIPHYGRLLDGSDAPVTGQRKVTLRVYAKSRTSGNFEELWEETHDQVEVAGGLFSVMAGEVQALDESIFDPSDPLYFPERELSFQVGDDAEMSPRLKIGSTIYALRALDAEALGGRAPDAYALAADLVAAGTAAASTFLAKTGGTVSGNLTVSGASNTLTVEGDTRLDHGTVTNNFTVNGTLSGATVQGGTIDAATALKVDGQNTDARYARLYRHDVTVTAGKIKPLSRFRSAPEGSISLLAQVQSKTVSHSGTNLYLFQGGYDQVGPAWRLLEPLSAGRGHGDGAGGFDLYVRAGPAADRYEYEFGAAAVTNNKTLVVTFHDLTGGDTVRTDIGSAAEEDVSNAGTLYSLGTTTVGGNLGVGTVASSGRIQTPNELGDKLVVWDGNASDRYGIGLNNSNLSAFVPDGARFSLRNNGYDGTERFVVTGAGNVGIGTTSPATRLHVESGGSVGVQSVGSGSNFLANATAATGAFGHLQGQRNGVLKYYVGLDASDNFSILSTGAAPMLSITNAGNTGVGTTTPASKLEVAGTVRADDFVKRDGTRIIPTLLQTTQLAQSGTLTVSGQNYPTDFCPAQNVTFPAAGAYKVDGVWAGNGGSCQHATCRPWVAGVETETGTDVWASIHNWSGNWWHATVHGKVSVASAGSKSVQWRCGFQGSCTGGMECYRFAVTFTGPF
jgi:hypothetical protein